MDLSILLNKDFRKFSNNLNVVANAHREIMKIRQMIWEDESAFNIRIKLKSLGLDFDNKWGDDKILKLMDELDESLMSVRELIQQREDDKVKHIDSKEIIFENYRLVDFNENCSKYCDFDAIYKNDKEKIDRMSIDEVEEQHDILVNMRQRAWCGERKGFPPAICKDYHSTTEYMKEITVLELKLKEIKTYIKSKTNAENIPSYKNGQKSSVITIEQLVLDLGNIDNIDNNHDLSEIAEAVSNVPESAVTETISMLVDLNKETKENNNPSQDLRD